MCWSTCQVSQSSPTAPSPRLSKFRSPSQTLTFASFSHVGRRVWFHSRSIDVTLNGRSRSRSQQLFARTAGKLTKDFKGMNHGWCMICQCCWLLAVSSALWLAVAWDHHDIFQMVRHAASLLFHFGTPHYCIAKSDQTCYGTGHVRFLPLNCSFSWQLRHTLGFLD